MLTVLFRERPHPMHPLLIFASGLAAGVAGIRLLKNVKAPEGLRASTTERLESMGEKARHGLDVAQAGLRQAAVSGLSVIEKSSASLRDRLAVAGDPAASATDGYSDAGATATTTTTATATDAIPELPAAVAPVVGPEPGAKPAAGAAAPAAAPVGEGTA